jgi:rhamnosyltransferase
MNRMTDGELMEAKMEGNSQPVCSIVIRAYNEARHIGRLLAGIAQQSLKEFEVILVDSGSTDDTVSVATQGDWGFPLRVVSIQPSQFTFGYSLNRGIAEAKSNFVVIASAHVYPVYPDWLERLLAPFADPKVALSYGKQRGNAVTRFSEHRIFAQWYPEVSQPRQSHPFCNNANAAIRRELWQVHPYDETLTGLEDLEWAHWAMGQGYAISYVAEAEVIHPHQESWHAIYNRYRREAMAFRRIFPQEHFGFADFLRLYITNVVSDLRQAAHQKVLRDHFGDILRFRLMQFWGTYQGFRQSSVLTWQLRRTFYYPQGGNPSSVTVREIEPIRYNEPIEGS